MNTTTFPPGYLEESRQNDVYAAATVPYFFAVIAVILRFWSRRHMRAGYWLDDWLIFLALLCGCGLMANTLWWTPRGFAKHIQAFGPDVGFYFALGDFIAELTYTGVIVSVKYSIIALYWRIFGKTNIKIPLCGFLAAVTAWGLSVLFLTIFQCVPTQGFWDKTIDAVCNVDAQAFLFGISIPNIVIDVGLLILPIPYILRLHMSTSQKRMLCSLFLLGGFVCIASILRLVSVVQESGDPDITWSYVNQGIWALVETDFAMIGACLPCLRPVWTALLRRHGKRQTSAVSKQQTSTATLTPSQRTWLSRKRAKGTIWDESLLRTQNDPVVNDEYNTLNRNAFSPDSLPYPETAAHNFTQTTNGQCHEGIELTTNISVQYQTLETEVADR